MVGVRGIELAADERDFLRDPAVGGVILFKRNFYDHEQLCQLIASISSLREPQLLIAVDQEGGRVQRFGHGFSPLPAVAAYGREYDLNPANARTLARLGGWLMATELRAVGVDFSFAPVLDLFSSASKVIGDRSFHGCADAVIELGRAFARGAMAAGMSTVAKHFPGHGSVEADSHTELPLDDRSYRVISQHDLRPFACLLGTEISGCMPAHVLYSAVDDRPACFSTYWIRNILRGKLGFNGAVFSDDLEMAGAEVMGDMTARAAGAIAAGCDMVLVCNEQELAAQALNAVIHPSTAASARLAGMRGHDSKPVVAEHLEYARWRIRILIEAVSSVPEGVNTG